MTKDKPDYFGSDDAANHDNDTGIPKPTQPNVTEDTAEHLANIDISHIRGPLVIFYGPAGCGKTVTLLRLSEYISRQYNVSAIRDFRDDGQYEAVIDEFERIRSNMENAPNSTGLINFLLLNIGRSNGGTFCQLLEASGEHFFSSTGVVEYPPYLLKIFNTQSYRKVYVFFFTAAMFEDSKKNRKYADSITELINNRIDSKQDKIIILYNKCDTKKQWFRNKKPIEKLFREDIYKNSAYTPLINLLNTSRFKKSPFITFSSGDFTEFATRGVTEKKFTPSPEFYPKNLWDAIYKSIRGSSWFGL